MSSVSTQSEPEGIRTPNLLSRSNSMDPTGSEATCLVNAPRRRLRRSWGRTGCGGLDRIVTQPGTAEEVAARVRQAAVSRRWALAIRHGRSHCRTGTVAFAGARLPALEPGAPMHSAAAATSINSCSTRRTQSLTRSRRPWCEAPPTTRPWRTRTRPSVRSPSTRAWRHISRLSRWQPLSLRTPPRRQRSTTTPSATATGGRERFSPSQQWAARSIASSRFGALVVYLPSTIARHQRRTPPATPLPQSSESGGTHAQRRPNPFASAEIVRCGEAAPVRPRHGTVRP